jgi:hypothetical protein
MSGECVFKDSSTVEFDPIKRIRYVIAGEAFRIGRLLINVHVDPAYMAVLQQVTSKIPGTEILKTNCAASSLFIAGIINTKEYVEETQVGQVSKYLARTDLGRNSTELLRAVCNLYSKQATIDTHMLKMFINTKEFDKFNTECMAFLRTLIHPGRATLVIYRHGPKNGHVVTVANIDGKLYMYDYQQQYVIPEENIIRIIVNQCMDKTFTSSLRTDPSLRVHHGYGYIKSEETAKIPEIYLMIALTDGEPILDGPGRQSKTIQSFTQLYKLMETGGPPLAPLFARIIDPMKDVDYYTPEILTDIAEKILVGSGVNVEIEPEFSPQVEYPMASFVELARARTRHLDGPGHEKEKEAAMQKLFETDYLESRPYSSWNSLRDLLKMNIVDRIKQYVDELWKLKYRGNTSMWPA